MLIDLAPEFVVLFGVVGLLAYAAWPRRVRS